MEKLNYHKFLDTLLILLIAYFLSVAYLYIGATRYKGIIENKINVILDSNILEYDSKFKPQIVTSGFLIFGKKWYQKFPAPNLLLGIMLVATFSILFYSEDSIKNINLALLLLVICSFIALYVFIIFPILINKKFKNFDENKKS